MRDPVYRSLYEAIVLHGAEAAPEILAESLEAAAIEVMETIRGEPGAVHRWAAHDRRRAATAQGAIAAGKPR